MFRETRDEERRCAVILVVANDDGTFTEQNPERAVLWVRDRYVGQADVILDCVSCKRRIQDTEFMICVDRGETAHVWCVKTDCGDVPSSGRIWWEGYP